MKTRKANLSKAIIIILVLLQGCTMVTVTVSDQRNSDPQSVELDKDVKITTWGAIKVNKSHFFPSSFQIKSADKVIYIDPVETTGGDKADYIFITHAHPDHLSLKTIEQIVKPETVFICPQSVFKKLSGKNYEIVKIKPGEVVELDKVRCEAISEYNTRNVFLWIKAHPRSKQHTGFILTFNNNMRIYHAGDTDYIPEMKSIKNINVAMVPIGGDNLTMNAEEAANLINEIGPDIAIPMHYELMDSNRLKDFKSMVDKNIEVKVLE